MNKNDKVKIGKLAQETFKPLFEDGKIPEEEIINLLDAEYSKDTFGINYPFLKRKIKDEKTDEYGKDYKSEKCKGGRRRYYSDSYGEYFFCNHWYKKSKDAFIQWADKYK
jgi:hypothetical protein